MEFRPCIDIHNGKVKQIVGGSLRDEAGEADENFVSEYDAAFYAAFYKERNITGGHIIMLNTPESEFFQATKAQALEALRVYPRGLQIGGGITAENAMEYIGAGASHVIVTSYVFQDGQIQYDHLKKIKELVGRDRLVLDLSCRIKNGSYYIVTDRWQKYTKVCINSNTLEELSAYCSEFLIHAVDVEGKAEGIENELVELLGEWSGIPITYAGGVHSYDDLWQLKELGGNRINVTIGSALDLFGGKLKFDEVLELLKK